MTKIGITSDIKKRLSTFVTGSGCELELRYLSPPIDEAAQIEVDLHRMFQEFRAKGEWFNGHVDEITATAKISCLAGTADKRSVMYANGISITEIAKTCNVSRQAILKHLKTSGLYHKSQDELTNALAPVGTSCPININEVIDLSEAHKQRGNSREKRLGKNLYVVPSGYLVKYFVSGVLHESTYTSKEDLLAAMQ